MVLPTQLKSKKKWMQMTTVPGAAIGGVNGHAVSDPVSVNMNIKRVQVSSRSHTLTLSHSLMHTDTYALKYSPMHTDIFPLPSKHI